MLNNKTTVQDYINALNQLPSDAVLSLCGSNEWYLYQNSPNGYRLDHTVAAFLGNITSHKLVATNTQEPLFSEWVDAIVERILDDPSCFEDIADETELGKVQVDMLTNAVIDSHRFGDVLTTFLTENPSITYKLIGTSVIEEGYFDESI